jgi:hypothetical protein
VMGVRASAIVGGSMLVMCCLISGAAAFESHQTVLPTTSPPAFSLPAFLDSARLPALQEAWHTQVEPAVAPPLHGFGAAPADAPVMKSVKPEGREAAAVRQRAEELSRRFSAGEASKPANSVNAPDPIAPPYAVGADPSADRSSKDLPADTPPPSHVGALNVSPDAAAATGPSKADTTTAALPDSSDKTQAPATKHSAGRSAHLSVGIPPLPVRAPRKATAAAEMRAPAVHRSRRVTSPMAAPPVNEHREVFPPYLGAPGWNAQRR